MSNIEKMSKLANQIDSELKKIKSNKVALADTVNQTTDPYVATELSSIKKSITELSSIVVKIYQEIQLLKSSRSNTDNLDKDFK